MYDSYSNQDFDPSDQYYIKAFHGRYIAAHPDGLLVTDDDDIKHHDIQWRIIPCDNNRVALQIVKHQKYLSTEDHGTVRCFDDNVNNDSLWEMKQLENGKYAFRSCYGRWLNATGMTDDNPPETQPHLFANKEHHHQHAQFDVIPVKQ